LAGSLSPFLLPQQIIGQAAGGIKLALLSGKGTKGLGCGGSLLQTDGISATNVPVG